MKIVYVILGLLLFTSASFAGDKGDAVVPGKSNDGQSEQSESHRRDNDDRYNDNSVVRWKRIVGVISAVNVNNPVGNINSGTFPWSARSGHARVNLSTGAASFEVDGLVIIGQIFSGTPGPVSKVTGTLVCNPGDETQAVLDTAPVPLNQQGEAHFSGRIEDIPATCANPLFLVRIATPTAAAGLWIATGAERFIGNFGNYGK